MGKDISGNRSENSHTCSWNIDDALQSLQDADEKIREFLEKKKRAEQGQEEPLAKQQPISPPPDSPLNPG